MRWPQFGKLGSPQGPTPTYKAWKEWKNKQRTSRTTNLAGEAADSAVKSLRTSAGRNWVKNAPEQKLLRVKSIYEVINLFFTYLSAFFQKIENFKSIFALNSRVRCPNRLVLQISSSFDRLYAGLAEIFHPWLIIYFFWKWSYFVTKARYLATFALSHLSLTHHLSTCSHLRSLENLRQKTQKNIKNT